MTSNQIAYFRVNEDQRHNYEQESNNRNVLAESKRSNLANEQLKNDSNNINRAHYERMDSESVRHNQSTESIQQAYNNGSLYNQSVANSISAMNAETNQRNAATNEYNAESQRQQAYASQSQASTAARNATTNTMNANTSRYVAKTTAKNNANITAYRKAEVQNQNSLRDAQKDKTRANIVTDIWNVGANVTKAVLPW